MAVNAVQLFNSPEGNEPAAYSGRTSPEEFTADYKEA